MARAESALPAGAALPARDVLPARVAHAVLAALPALLALLPATGAAQGLLTLNTTTGTE